MSRWPLIPGLVAALCLAPRAAWAGDEQEFEVAKSLLDGAQYAEAASRFSRMFDAAATVCPGTAELSAQGCRLTDPAIIQRARGYYAHALVALDRDADAKAQLRELLKETPTFSPSPAVFPKKVIELYIDVKKELEQVTTDTTLDQQRRKKEREQAERRYVDYVRTLEELAKTETVVETRSRFLAALPLGIGQFHNGNTGLGVLFASAEGSAIVVAVVTGALHADLAARAVSASQTDTGSTSLQTDEVETDLLSLRVANNIAMGALAVTMIAGLIEAQLSFEDSIAHKRTRTLPERPPKPVPEVSFGGVPDHPDAVGLGVFLHF